MGNVFGPVVSHGCRSGVLRWAPVHGTFDGSRHVLTDASGNILLSVRSDAVPLDRLVGQAVTLCGQVQVYFGQGQPARMVLVAGAVQPVRQAGCG